MIPQKTPTLAAIAWITVVMAYAWASNRDHDDAELARRAGSEEREAGSGEREENSHPSPLTPHPAPRAPSLPE